MTPVSLSLLLTLGLSLAACDAAPAPTAPVARGRVMGVVWDTVPKQPVAGVRAQAHDLGRTYTDPPGHFELSLPAGEHRLWLHRAGFIDGQRTRVHVRARRTTELEVHVFARQPDDATLHRYVERLQSARDARSVAAEATGPADLLAPVSDVGAARAALTEPVPPAVIRVWRSSRAGALAPSSGNGWADNSCDAAGRSIPCRSRTT